MADQKGDLYLAGYSGLTQSDISNFLGKTFSSQEQSLASSLIASVEDYIARQCRRNFKYSDSGGDQVYFDTLSGGANEYMLHNFPVKAITKVVVDGVDITSQLTLGTDYTFDDNKIYFLTLVPLGGRTNIVILKVYYTIYQFWGEDLKTAIKQYVADVISNREYAGKPLLALNANGFLLHFDKDAIPQYLQAIINQYRQVLI